VCFPKPPKPPPVVKSDPVADEAKAVAESTQRANAELAMQRRSRAKSRLSVISPSGASDTPGRYAPPVVRPGAGGQATTGNATGGNRPGGMIGLLYDAVARAKAKAAAK
jgi:hypothetical protein